MPDRSDLLPELERIVREAGRIAISLQAGTSHTVKPDGTIVTPADERVERFLRDELRRLLPDVGVYGEELVSTEEEANGLWCLDPIDGTSNYAFGSPLWGVSVGLIQEENASLGIVFLPALQEMYLAAKGHGASFNGRPIPAIPPGGILPQHLVSYPDRILRMYPSAKLPGKMRHTGAFVVDAMFTVIQRFRALLGVREKLYDVAASLCIAGEVGAEIRYADGDPLLLEPLKDPNSKLEKGWMIFPSGADLTL
jgi:myo-inositol-1(or 4)-monophosphatase